MSLHFLFEPLLVFILIVLLRHVGAIIIVSAIAVAGDAFFVGGTELSEKLY
jgi:hypothetical protein